MIFTDILWNIAPIVISLITPGLKRHSALITNEMIDAESTTLTGAQKQDKVVKEIYPEIVNTNRALAANADEVSESLKTAIDAVIMIANLIAKLRGMKK